VLDRGNIPLHPGCFLEKRQFSAGGPAASTHAAHAEFIGIDSTVACRPGATSVASHSVMRHASCVSFSIRKFWSKHRSRKPCPSTLLRNVIFLRDPTARAILVQFPTLVSSIEIGTIAMSQADIRLAQWKPRAQCLKTLKSASIVSCSIFPRLFCLA
jgi:hypothetical protein